MLVAVQHDGRAGQVLGDLPVSRLGGGFGQPRIGTGLLHQLAHRGGGRNTLAHRCCGRIAARVPARGDPGQRGWSACSSPRATAWPPPAPAHVPGRAAAPAARPRPVPRCHRGCPGTAGPHPATPRYATRPDRARPGRHRARSGRSDATKATAAHGRAARQPRPGHGQHLPARPGLTRRRAAHHHDQPAHAAGSLARHLPQPRVMVPRHIPRQVRQLHGGTGLHRPVHSHIERVQPGQRPQLQNAIRLRPVPSHPGQHLRRHHPGRQHCSQDGRHRHQPRQPARAASHQRPDEKTQRCEGQHHRGRRHDGSSQRALPAPEKREPAVHSDHSPARHFLAVP